MASTNLYPLFQKGLEDNFFVRMEYYEPEWRRIFHVHGTGDRYIWKQGWQGYDIPEPRIPGQRIVQQGFQPSFGKAYIIQNFGLGDAVPEEDIEDDIYGVIKYSLAAKAGFMAVAFMDLWQYRTAGFFQNQGYATGNAVAGMADGVSLFNTAHPIAASNLGATYSNRPSNDADLSVSSWQVMSTALRVQKYPNNRTFSNNKLRCIVINPALSYVAWEIRHGKPYKPNSADFTMNRIADEGVDIIEWPYFQKSGATGTNNAWFGVGQNHSLNFYMRSAPKSKTDYDVGTNSQIVIMLTRGDYGADDARGTYGSSGL